MKCLSKNLGVQHKQNAEIVLADQENDESDHKTLPQNTTNSTVNAWIKKHNLKRLEQHLIKHDLFSVDKLKQFALSNDSKQTTSIILTENRIANNKDDHKSMSYNEVESNFESGLNALLINTLGKTDDFLSKLKQLCQNKNNNKWVLILIDCDDIGLLLHDKKISMIEAQNSINLLNANICRIIDKNDNIFGYHLGSDLFGLFVYDDKNTMKKSVEIVEHLLDVMRNKHKSSFTISVGIGLRNLNDDGNSNNYNHESIEREWVLSAHINLLRAKENGKNCYFNKPNTIDSTKDNKKLATITVQAQKSYQLYLRESENIIDNALDNFDQETIIKQTVTAKNKKRIESIYLLKALIIFYRKTYVGNFKYRAYAAAKWINLALKTFILGNMSIECYYYYKTLQEEIETSLDYEIFQTKYNISKQVKERIDDPSNLITSKYDLTVLTRKRSADAVVAPVIKHTSLYYSKNAFEHLSDTSEAPLIGSTFGYDVSELGRKAYEYAKQIYVEVLNLEPNDGMAASNLLYILWDLEKYNEYVDYAERFIKSLPGHIRVLWEVAHRYCKSCETKINKQMEKARLSKDERLTKAIKYGQQMIDAANNDKQWIKYGMYLFYGELLHLWSKDFDNSKEQQRLALKIYEKGIKIDQQFGYDIINNWIRDFDKFEHELINMIVSYWYLPHSSTKNDILDCGDLIETYFNQDKEKMKRAKLLSNIVPEGGNIRKFLAPESETHNLACYFVSIRRPGKFNQAVNSDAGTLNFDNFGTVIGSWFMDEGGVANNNRIAQQANEPPEEIAKFSPVFAAKLAYFFTFWKDYKDFIINELGLTIDLIKQIRVVMIKLLIHYAFKIEKQEHENFMQVIQDSTNMTNMVRKIDDVITLHEIAVICNKIEKIIDLKDEKVIANTIKIITPNIVTNNRRIESVNRVNMTALYTDAFDFESEMLCCFVQLVGRGNQYDDDNLFQNWDVESNHAFLCALTCCVLEIFCQIAKEYGNQPQLYPKRKKDYDRVSIEPKNTVLI